MDTMNSIVNCQPKASNGTSITNDSTHTMNITAPADTSITETPNSPSTTTIECDNQQSSRTNECISNSDAHPEHSAQTKDQATNSQPSSDSESAINNSNALVVDSKRPYDIIKIQTQEGAVVEIELETARLCAAVRKKLKANGNNYDEVIVVPNVSYNALLKVLEWCRFHCPPQHIHESPPPDPSLFENSDDEVEEGDQQNKPAKIRRIAHTNPALQKLK
eukprot:GEZU01004047.1.p1 GENE.GEZU01004047.1~~GEZU01004047.1.p1  ORF type:complete len:220 (-),score=29.17 GEZU01004047.1:507-1166(-)